MKLTNTNLNVLKCTLYLLETGFHTFHCDSNTKGRDNIIPPISVITGEQPTSLNMDTITRE